MSSRPNRIVPPAIAPTGSLSTTCTTSMSARAVASTGVSGAFSGKKKPPNAETEIPDDDDGVPPGNASSALIWREHDEHEV